ncbi:tail fiber assembly protein [Escherichia coli]|uniref:tail fiber assembly protein n=1 Tax=Escherichia coli TaxID=562 RepID=UPI002473ECB1|nr:tail fiber assembly protein [Escherichia coli]MDT9109332.1 tail fiber assembly protein [Escherichia coli]HDQ0309627.1 tail fiber assembly protein [Escherichia coli]HDV4953537.1 tail fiber assembly protein [Escherichia coli]HDV4977784.1 tail fiber assembly protein [Escherichia coli]
MKPIFDENGLATEAGDIRCYYFDPDTFEYTGWSDEYINLGVSMPGNSTDIDPGEAVAGKVSLFTGTGWRLEEDHRGETVYSTADRSASTVDYIGAIKDGFTSVAPESMYDNWNGSSWVTDTSAQHAEAVSAATLHAQQLVYAAMQSISVIQLKLQAGRTLTDTEKTKLNNVLDYIDAVNAVDTSTAPDVIWPELPEA